jgi:hypothetical protein
MRKFAIAYIDAHVSNFVGWMKKDQVPGLQVGFRNRDAGPDLHGGGSGKLNFKDLAIDSLNEAGTVYTLAIAATHFMWRSSPCAHGCTQALFDGGYRDRRPFFIRLGIRHGRSHGCNGTSLGYRRRVAATHDQAGYENHQNSI